MSPEPTPSPSTPSAATGALAALASWSVAGSVVSLMGLLYQLGFDGLAFVVGPVAGLVLGSILLAPQLARSGAVSIPDFLRRRLGRPAQVLAALTIALTALILAVAGISSAASLLRFAFGMPFPPSAVVAALAATAIALPSSGIVRSRLGALLGLLILAAVLGTAFALTLVLQGPALPHIAYGQALARIGDLERTLIVNGLASAQTLKPHLNPFLQIEPLSFAAIVLSLMAGTALLPLMLFGASPSPRAARATSAWTAALVLALALTAPVYAALAKVQFYETLAGKIALTALPSWLETPSRDGKLHIHGTSLALYETVSSARQSGALDIGSVTGKLAQDADAAVLKDWQALSEPVKKIVLDTLAAIDPTASTPMWDIYCGTLLPAVAAVSGNKQALLTLTALEIDPEVLILTLPQRLGLPYAITVLLAAGALASALAIASAAIAAAGRAIAGDEAPTRYRLAALGTAAAALSIAVVRHGTIDGLAPAALGFAAAGLFPALVLGLWWRRTGGAAAALGIAVGLALALGYTIGTHYAAVPFTGTWSAWSGTAPGAMRKFEALEAQWIGATSDNARETAWTALSALASGTPFVPGTANWFGIPAVASAAFALPLAFGLIILGSFLPRRPGREEADIVTRLRQPADIGTDE